MPPEPLYLRLCPDCAGEPVEVGTCRTCAGAGVLDKDDRPFEPGPPFDGWTPRQLVRLDQDARRRRAAADARRQADLPERITMSRTPEGEARVELEPRRRLTLSDVVELLLSRGSAGDGSTVRLTRNARGETQIEVYVRSGEPGIETVEQARAKAEQQYDHLRSLYPMGGTPTGGAS